MTTDGLLLDTCALIWLSQDEFVRPSAKSVIERAANAKVPICVSAMTAWEIGMLISKDRLPTVTNPLPWFEQVIHSAGLEVRLPTPEIFIASSFLPELAHKDPVDRIIIATARAENYAIVTRDRTILAYGAAGHVKTVRC